MFCPLIKDECRNEQCVMWGDEECLIIPVLKYFGNSEEESPDDQTEIEEEVPEEIKSATPIELADELSDHSINSPIWRETHYIWIHLF